jgi:hypothetical protein
MQKSASIASSLSLAFFLSSCITISTDGVKHYTFSKSAVAGQRKLFRKSAQVNIDCSAGTMPSVRVTEYPLHGTVTMSKEADFNKFNGDYAKCRSAKVDTAATYYTPSKNFTGIDRFTIRVSYHDGNIKDVTFDIRVTK